jgi:hypothetical protein
MSVREEKILSLTNVDLSKKSTKELKALIQRGLIRWGSRLLFKPL